MLGGSLVNEREEIDGRPGHAWAAGIVAALEALPEVTLLPRTTVFGWYDDNIFGAVERVADHKPVPGPHEPRQRYWRIHARQAVLAAGAEERPLVFGGNDRPGVMLASAVRTYVNRYAAAPGRNGVVFTNNDSGYRTARDLIAAGIGVQAVVDSRDAAPSLDAGGARVIAGGVVTDVSGGRAINGVGVHSSAGHDHIDCDFVAMSGGWNPTLSLACHRGAKPQWNDTLSAFVPAGDHAAFAIAGAANGTMVLSDCLRQGAEKGARAAGAAGFDAKPAASASVEG